MSKLIPMILTGPQKWHGKLLKRGSRIEATDREAKVLKALGRARPELEHVAGAPVVEVQKPVEPTPAPAATPKRTYKRRDVQPLAPTVEAEPPRVLTVEKKVEEDEPDDQGPSAWNLFHVKRDAE